MRLSSHPVQYLLSVPPAMAGRVASAQMRAGEEWFATCDPPGSRLGSGGGTAHLLAEVWRATADGAPFRDWLRQSQKLIVHGGGQSRRLPAYAAVGKPFIPIPAIRHARGQSLDQSLLDMQIPGFLRILDEAPERIVAMVTCGDMLLTFGRALPRFPDTDVIGVGMAVEPEQAERFGVFFTRREPAQGLTCFLQKPSADTIRSLSADMDFVVDTGIWLLSENAVMALMDKCGWESALQRFADGGCRSYELYAGFGLSLGSHPEKPDPGISALTSSVVALPEPGFYHMGTSRQLIESVTVLQNAHSGSAYAGMRHPDQIVQNSRFDPPARRLEHHTLWIESSHVPSCWSLRHGHVFTGVPQNDWRLELEPGVCLDCVPVDADSMCIRAYGLDDPFSGALDGADTLWFGRPAAAWLSARGISFAEAGIDPSQDIQSAPLFPLLPGEDVDEGFVEWLFRERPDADEKWRRLWLSLPRISAEDIRLRTNVERLEARRGALRTSALHRMYTRQHQSIFYSLDLATAARIWYGSGMDMPAQPEGSALGPLDAAHDHMFRAALLREAGRGGWNEHEERAFACLRDAILSDTALTKSDPECRVLEDQIVWGRSPARLDLAGGWTDTPPFCLEHGGRVVNLAVNLNGQPPVQVFAKRCPRPELVVRSIDQGVEQRIRTYDELDTFARPGSEFALAKAAVALAGFLPRYHISQGFHSLEQQFRAFGAGIELSLLAAMPAGSGLGTSSVLAATLLGVLSELCGLGWDRHALVARTLAVEQMLTTGGGWQDQAGAIFPGVKLVETAPGLAQTPTVRWLPDRLFSTGYANELALLYYTGLTRMAKGILQEIVRGIFLNSGPHLRILERLHEHAKDTFDALQRSDWDAACEAVRISWILNQQLDSGTNPPEVQAILDRIGEDVAGAKLLGAGGGGYMLILARCPEAGVRIRRTLEQSPPNARAHFVDISVSQTGLEITRS